MSKNLFLLLFIHFACILNATFIPLSPAHAQLNDALRNRTIPTPRIPLPERRIELPDRTIEVTADYFACNVMQIHLERRNFWDDVYIGYGVERAALNSYVADLTIATRELCNENADSDAFRRAADGVVRFRRGVDERNAELFGSSPESAFRYRLAALEEIDRWIGQNCFSEDSEFLSLPFARFPMSPDIGSTVPSLPSAAAIGECGSGAPSATPGGGSGIDTSTVSAGLAGVSQCLANYRTQATACNNPAGVNAERAEELIEKVSESCVESGSCQRTVTENEDGTIETTIEHTRTFRSGTTATVSLSFKRDANGELVEFSMQQVVNQPNGFSETASLRLTDAPETQARKILPSAPPAAAVPSVSSELIDDMVSYEMMRRALEWVPGIELPPLPIPGARLQCESFASPGRQIINFANPGAASGDGGGLGNPLLSPDDAIADCLCEGGRYGQQLANTMGFSCGARSPDVRKRLFCMRAGGETTLSDLCTNLAEQDNGGGVDLSSMCSAVMQCPPDAALTGGVIDGQLRCGCGRSFPPGRQRNQCATVSCPGPGVPMNDDEAACCRAPSFRTLTPRMQLQRALELRERIRGFETPLPTGLSVPVAETLERSVDAPIETPRRD